jgi:CMP-N,N'-diacetyllegionaminic acid synthase
MGMSTNHRIKTLAIIPARKGSKRLPGKNVKMLMGKPLIAWTIEQAKRCEYFDEIIISTDCSEIANIAQEFGASVPFLRPKELSQDLSSSMDLVEHALNHYVSEGVHFDNVALLEPTSPLRKKDDLNNAMSSFLEKSEKYHSLISVGKIEREHPSIIKRISEDYQLSPYTECPDKEHAYFPYGVIYASKVSALLKTKTFYQPQTLPYVIERWQNFEIDDEVDFLCTEKLIEKFRDKL